MNPKPATQFPLAGLPLKDPPALRNPAQDAAKLAQQSRTTLLAPAPVHRERGSLPLALPQRRDYVAVVLADIAKLASPSPTCIPIGASPAAAYFHPLRGPCDFKPPSRSDRPTICVPFGHAFAKRYPHLLSEPLWLQPPLLFKGVGGKA